MSMYDVDWNELSKTTQDQEEMIRRMSGFDRSEWLGSLRQGARHQVRYAINTWSEEERESHINLCAY